MSSMCQTCGAMIETGDKCDDCKDPIMEATSMDGKAPLDQAKKAIQHTLHRISEHPTVGWYCGAGTATFALLTEAAATLFGEPVRKVREYYQPKDVTNPQAILDRLRQLTETLQSQYETGGKYFMLRDEVVDELEKAQELLGKVRLQ